MTTWRKSSYSQTDGTTDCVELAGFAGVIRLRDSKNPAGDQLSLSTSAFTGLLRRIKSNTLDLPR